MVANTSNIFSGGENLLILFSYSPRNNMEIGGSGEFYTFLAGMRRVQAPAMRMAFLNIDMDN